MNNIFDERIEAWREKRLGKITSSELNHFILKGKGSEWNAKTIAYLYKVKYQRRTGCQREEKSNSNFEWGHSCEPLAIEILRENYINEVVNCANDFDEIVFNVPFNGFGDSPDYYILEENSQVEIVGEIKAPVDEAKMEQILEIESIKDTEYYGQCLGHLIGKPEAKKCQLVFYDGISYKILKAFEITRDECKQDIDYLTKKIKSASDYIDKCIAVNCKLSDIVNIKIN